MTSVLEGEGPRGLNPDGLLFSIGPEQNDFPESGRGSFWCIFRGARSRRAGTPSKRLNALKSRRGELHIRGRPGYVKTLPNLGRISVAILSHKALPNSEERVSVLAILT